MRHALTDDIDPMCCGHTGEMAGEHPLSWLKITLAILAAILVVIGFVLLTNR